MGKPKTQANNRRPRGRVKNRTYYERNENFGIYWRKDRNTWRVQIRVKGVKAPQKTFHNFQEAKTYRDSILKKV